MFGELRKHEKEAVTAVFKIILLTPCFPGQTEVIHEIPVTVVVTTSEIHIQNLSNECQLALLELKRLKINDGPFLEPPLLFSGIYFVLTLLQKC
jgi:hypothetical protein